jgi:hypothetical protein
MLRIGRGPWVLVIDEASTTLTQGPAACILIGKQPGSAGLESTMGKPVEQVAYPERGTYALGAFVRGRRRANGISLRALAELAGVGLRFLSELERGKQTLRLDRVDAVLAVFGKQVGVVDRGRG